MKTPNSGIANEVNRSLLRHKPKSLWAGSWATCVTALICITSFLGFLGCRKQQPARRITVQMDAPERLWVRVLLLEDVNSCMFECGYPFEAVAGDTNTPIAHFDALSAPVDITANAGKISFAGWLSAGGELTIAPAEPYIFTLDGKEYRGEVSIVRKTDVNFFDVVNRLPVEPYLAGVVGAEMPSYWEPAALEAQAIAARTYCLYIKKRLGQNRHWDLRKTQANQLYRGVSAESAQTWAAINRTKGVVLTCTHPDGQNDIFCAYYSAVCAGHTENAKNVFGDQVEPLVGVPCPYCKQVAKPDFFAWPTVKMKKTTVTNRLLERYPNLKQLGSIQKIAPLERSSYKNLSRVTVVKLTGSTGNTATLRAEDFRLAIDPTGLKIKSASFEIRDEKDRWAFVSGRGFGHGVGLCQCGAEGLARKGKTARQILKYYYPKSSIEKIY